MNCVGERRVGGPLVRMCAAIRAQKVARIGMLLLIRPLMVKQSNGSHRIETIGSVCFTKLI